MRTRAALPVDWAAAMMNLAQRLLRAHPRRPGGEHRAGHCRLPAGAGGADPVGPARGVGANHDEPGSAYYSRICGDRAENLEQAIAAYRQALEVRTRQALPVDWAAVMMNLANAYSDRIRGDRAENLEQAIAAYRQALEVQTRAAMPVEWAIVMLNLANAYKNRIRGDRAENIEQAIATYRQALEVRTRAAMPVEWAQTMTNLANAYSDRIRGDRAENLEQAIAVYRQALEVLTRAAMPVEWAAVMLNLANAYSDRIRGDRAENLEQAIAAYGQALEICTPDTLPDYCRRAARGLANLCFAEGRYDQVVEPYRLVTGAIDILLQGSLARGSKEVELDKIRGLSGKAAYALAKQDRLEEAVEALEHGRARLLAEALEQNRHDLERLPALGNGDLLARYRAAAGRIAVLQAQAVQSSARRPDELAAAPRDFAVFSEEMEAARSDLDAAIAVIRQIPGYENFFLPPTFEKIRQAATPAAPLVYLVVTSAGGLVLALHSSNRISGGSQTRQKWKEQEDEKDQEAPVVSAVWLDGITEPRLREILANLSPERELGGYLGAYDRWRRPTRDRAAWDAWLAAIDNTTRWLWDAVMGPVVDHLSSSPWEGVRSATLIPTGLLALLPLYAAWTEDAARPTGRRYALDDVAFGHAASAEALVQSQSVAAATAADRLLAVDEPRPVRGNPLPNSAAEVAAIASLFEKPHVLRYEQATRAAVLDALPKAQVVHLSCHGANGWSEPLASGMVMAGDEMLTVGDLQDRRLPAARLATLSACETGIVGTKLPDEVIALPTALAQAGFAGVVASLWSVEDVSTAMLMERFYRLWREDGVAPALALREAQRWLRDTTNREKAAYFGQDDPELLELAGLRMPQMIAADFFSRTFSDAQGLEARTFAHPFWWAAFYLTGV